MTINRIKMSFCFASILFALNTTGTSSTFKTIKAKNGDIYDCVDANKQPSLRHPVLKGHKVQLKPSRELNLLTERVNAFNNKTSEVRIRKVSNGQTETCPFGSIPMLRMPIHNLTKHAFNGIRPLDATSRPNSQFAGIVTNGDQVYTGVMADLSIYNPPVGPDQSSSSVIALVTIEGDTYNRIEAGWMVNPSLFGDSKTRLYVSWTRDGYRSTGCFNNQCPGFISVSSVMPLGSVFEDISKIGPEERTQLFVSFVIQLVGKEWWLNVDDKDVGYWPSDILTTGASGARIMKLGGEVSQIDMNQKSAPMGSGSKERLGFALGAAKIKRINLIDSNGNAVDPSGLFSAKICYCYMASQNSFKDEDEGYSFIYGGPGGSEDVCKRC